LPFAALTVKDVAPRGVALVELNVRVAVRVSCDEVKLTGLGENDAVTPGGSAVVTDKVTLKLPLDPGPVPRLIVTMALAELPGQSWDGVDAPTITVPTLGPSVKRV
jgi:hypothetical protein